MNRFVLDRRRLLSGALALGGVALLPAAAHAAADEHMEINSGDGRAVSLSLWRPETVRAAVVFSHGSGGRPENYGALFSVWRGAGLLIAAPLHVDSETHPRHDEFDRVQSFVARCSDLTATLSALSALAPDAPQAATGHSYGGLMSLLAGCGFPPFLPGPLPSVKAVVAFSSAGRIPNVIDERTYAGLNTPTLMVTGNQDVVSGIVTDWRDHLYPFETSPAGNKMALVYANGNHNLIGGALAPGAGAADAMANSADFVLAHAARDAGAIARLAALRSNAVREVLRR